MDVVAEGCWGKRKEPGRPQLLSVPEKAQHTQVAFTGHEDDGQKQETRSPRCCLRYGRTDCLSRGRALHSSRTVQAIGALLACKPTVQLWVKSSTALYCCVQRGRYSANEDLKRPYSYHGERH